MDMLGHSPGPLAIVPDDSTPAHRKSGHITLFRKYRLYRQQVGVWYCFIYVLSQKPLAFFLITLRTISVFWSCCYLPMPGTAQETLRHHSQSITISASRSTNQYRVLPAQK